MARQTIQQWKNATRCDTPEDAADLAQQIEQLREALDRKGEISRALYEKLEAAETERCELAVELYGETEVRITDAGQKKINVIKAIREHTGLLLRAAKEASEGAVLRPAPEKLRPLLKDLADLGATVETQTSKAGVHAAWKAATGCWTPPEAAQLIRELRQKLDLKASRLADELNDRDREVAELSDHLAAARHRIDELENDRAEMKANAHNAGYREGQLVVTAIVRAFNAPGPEEL